MVFITGRVLKIDHRSVLWLAQIFIFLTPILAACSSLLFIFYLLKYFFNKTPDEKHIWLIAFLTSPLFYVIYLIW